MKRLGTKNEIIRHGVRIDGTWSLTVSAHCSCGHTFKRASRENITDQFRNHLRNTPYAAAPKREKKPASIG